MQDDPYIAQVVCRSVRQAEDDDISLEQRVKAGFPTEAGTRQFSV